MTTITLDPQRGHYVLQNNGGVSCFGYDNARDHTNQIAHRLGRPELRFADDDHGTESGYGKYLQAIDAWSNSPLRERTYFDPGTHADAERALESCRRRGTMCRLILGDTPMTASTQPEQSVSLSRPVPVFLAYFTAFPQGGKIVERPDVYKRDAKDAATLSVTRS